MPRIFFICLLCIAGLPSMAQKPVSKPVGGAAISGKLTSRNDSIQYILGAYVGQWIKGNGFVIANPPLFARGINDILLNQPPLVPDSIIATRLEGYQKSVQKDQALNAEQQLFSALKDKQGIGMFPNGVRYSVVKPGQGPRPAAKDSITLHMVAKLPDGTIVEDTYRAQQPFNAMPDSFFPALSEALQMMQEGSKWQVYFPAALAYGEKGTNTIPPNSAIILDLELVRVKQNR